MSRVRVPRVGEPIQILGRPLRFSYWPMYRASRRFGLQSHLYATNPWALIRASVQRDCSAASRAESLAYVAQSEYFFDAAAKSSEWAAKPLLLYYSFMNLSKAFIVTKAIRISLDQARHGLAEKLTSGGKELIDAYLEAHPSPSTQRANVFALLWEALSGHVMTSTMRLDLTYLLPQVVTGHRLWCEAADQKERFMSIESVQMLQDKATRNLWAVLQMHAGTISQHGIAGSKLLRESGLQGAFRAVRGFHDALANEEMLQFEQVQQTRYSHRSSDSVPQLIESFRHSLFATAITARPFREYYLYVAPAQERSQVLPQLLSLFAITYWLGSITRYRPQQFDRVIESKFGGQLQEFLSSQPTQFVYLFASEFARREITRPPLA